MRKVREFGNEDSEFSKQSGCDANDHGHDCQKIDKLVTAYHLAKKNLAAAIERDDFAKVQEHDKKVGNLFDTLLSVKPKDQAGVFMLATFLLDELCPTNEISNFRLQIKEKMKELVTFS